MRNLLFLTIFLFVSLWGCSNVPEKDGDTWIYPDGPTYEQKQALWDASLKVLNDYGRVQESIYDQGLLVVHSQVVPQFGENTRMVISCKIVEDDEGYFEPNVRVTNQYDRSLTHLYKVSEEQPSYQWTSGSFNTRLETEIYNKIMKMIEKDRKKFDSFPRSNPGPKEPKDTFDYSEYDSL
jgi:hypothetical protein